MTDENLIPWLYGLQHFGIKLGLDNIRALLRVLGRPDTAFPSVLVGGTNGKGSVAAMVQAVLSSAGVEAGLFTSPHLVRPHERIRVGRRDIDDVALQRLLSHMRLTVDDALRDGTLEAHPSFFEVITATALEAFRQRGVGAAVLEVGLGGRLDATNAVDAAVSVVVGVDLDHTKTLGPTLEDIAREKAGIVKAGRPLVSGAVRQIAASVLQAVCRERRAPFLDARVEVALVEEEAGGFTLRSRRRLYRDLRPALPGRHQIDNARVAVATLECLEEHAGLTIDEEAVRQGLREVRWPGRLQWLAGTDGAPDLLFDGAHNPAGVDALVRYLAARPGPRPVALFGAMHGKLLPAMLERLAPWIEALVIARPAVRRAADPDEVAEVARSYVETVETVPDPGEALQRAYDLAGGDRFVLVTGSLYLVGEVMGLLSDESAPGPLSM